MLQLNFGASALEDTAVLHFPSTPLRVTFIGDATLRGEGRLLSYVLIRIMLPFVKKGLTGVHVYSGTFQRVSSLENVMV
jgi:hypothetical protein